MNEIIKTKPSLRRVTIVTAEKGANRDVLNVIDPVPEKLRDYIKLWCCEEHNTSFADESVHCDAVINMNHVLSAVDYFDGYIEVVLLDRSFIIRMSLDQFLNGE